MFKEIVCNKEKKKFENQEKDIRKIRQIPSLVILTKPTNTHSEEFYTVFLSNSFVFTKFLE